MFTVSDEVFAGLQMRFIETPPSAFDDGMFKICSKINQIEGLVTTWCCRGHFNENDPGDEALFQIVICVTEAGRKNLETLYAKFCGAVGIYYNDYPIHHTTVMTVTRLCHPAHGGETDEELIWSWSIEMTLSDISMDGFAVDKMLTILG